MGYRTYGWVYLVSPAQFAIDPGQLSGQDVAMPSTDIPTATTWMEWLDLYCKELATTGSEQYAKEHRNRVRYFIQTTGLRELSAITPKAAVQWKDDLATNGQPRASDGYRFGPCGASAMRSHVAAMKAMWDWLVRMEAVRARPGCSKNASEVCETALR